MNNETVRGIGCAEKVHKFGEKFIMIRVNAGVIFNDFQENVASSMRGLYGASDHGPFSAHSILFLLMWSNGIIRGGV
jgi:hypothetical protein